MYTDGMRNAERCLLGIILLLLVPLIALPAQELPTVAAYSLTADDVGEHVWRTVNDLVFSFIRELRTYRIIDMRSEILPRDIRVPDGTDYIFYGYLLSQPDGIKLELVLKGGPYGITRQISRVYENSNRILLESRMLVRDLFDQSVSLPDPDIGPAAGSGALSQSGSLSENATQDGPSGEALTATDRTLVPVSSLDSLAGSWRGESGIDKVMILRGGRGVAVLSSGVSISLEIFLSGNDLVVRQKGLASPRQFIDLPDPVARQAANIAPPLEWIFRVTRDQSALVGTKKTVIIRNDGKNIISMESAVLDVTWSRD